MEPREYVVGDHNKQLRAIGLPIPSSGRKWPEHDRMTSGHVAYYRVREGFKSERVWARVFMVRQYPGIAEKGKVWMARQGIGEPIDWQK